MVIFTVLHNFLFDTTVLKNKYDSHALLWDHFMSNVLTEFDPTIGSSVSEVTE